MRVAPALGFTLTFTLQLLAIPWLSAVTPATAPQEGLRENVPRIHALVGGRVIPRPGETLEKATVILRNGIVEAVGREIDIPASARVWDLSGLTIYPGFIDAYAVMGDSVEPGDAPQQAPHWNDAVVPHLTAIDQLKLSDEGLEKRRELGFTTAHVVPKSGAIRGHGSLIQLTATEDPGRILNPKAAQHFAFITRSKEYPRSLMGCIALMRQTLHDARWHHQYQNVYRRHPDQVRPGEAQALEALAPLLTGKKLPAFFRLGNEADIERALRVADEFKLRRVLIDPGYAYRRWQPLAKAKNPVVLSLHFPEAPDVSDPDRALDVSLERLQHWEAAPSNAAILEEHGVQIALSTYQLEDDLKKFWPNLRHAVQHGLTEETALRALTQAPAQLLGEEHRLGTVAQGQVANLVVASGNLFREEKAQIVQVWIDGAPLKNDEPPHRGGARGKWETAWTGTQGPPQFSIDGERGALKLRVFPQGPPGQPIESKLTVESSDALSFTLPAKVFAGSEDDDESPIRLKGYLNSHTMVGQGILPDGQRFSWSARRLPQAPESSEKSPTLTKPHQSDLADQYPAGAYPGRLADDTATTPARRILVKGATLWTCGPEGTSQADLLIRNGRIEAIGKDLKAPKKARVIDASGKHLTPGLIDCHSHTAISRGVNEGSHAVTCEVRIGDVVDPTDISIYRQLAGGLTTANLLHGSANPMGGQNQVIKLRWGSDAEGLKFAGAKPGVKFALGENVKQANWGDDFTTRYPQTRMGVEQIMRDTFLAAREYGERLDSHHARIDKDGKKHTLPFRRDLRLEAVLEILRGERVVHIHSYRQDEILMFVRLAQEFGFTVATFQHVLEGYKIAHHLKEIEAGASSFSDWWGYKFEVYDAIPHNGALLHAAEVLTSFNSDDNEIATRLNTEAAKAVRYGGVSPDEALKFVTLNPAKQLRIDDQVGSLEVGKQADFAIWSGPPLSTLSRCEQTWIDGRCYFDLKTDAQLREHVAKERQRLITNALKVAKDSKDSKGNETKEKDGADTLDWATRLRLLSPWGQYELIDYQGLYHDGQSLHACTGCYCDYR